MPVDPEDLAKLCEARDWLVEHGTTDEERSVADTATKIERWVTKDEGK